MAMMSNATKHNDATANDFKNTFQDFVVSLTKHNQPTTPATTNVVTSPALLMDGESNHKSYNRSAIQYPNAKRWGDALLHGVPLDAMLELYKRQPINIEVITIIRISEIMIRLDDNSFSRFPKIVEVRLDEWKL